MGSDSPGEETNLTQQRKKWVLGKGDHIFRAIVTPGMEPLVAAELTALGAKVTSQDPGGVLFESSLLTAMQVNLRACAVERVWARVAEFRAKTFGELFHRTKRLDWSRVLSPGIAVQVTSAAHKSRLMHTGRIQQTVADALGHRLDDKEPTRQRLLARITNDRCTLSIDMSGERLHRRGYREEGASAPIRETRAAALLRWARWQPGQTVCDPCCGSGTFLVEAARAAAGIAPGADREFAFERWPKYDVAGFRRARTRASNQPSIQTKLVGVDSSPVAVTAAQRNSTRAGVDISIDVARFQDMTIPDTPGLLIANPPYGKRVRADLGQTWEDLGALFKGASQWRRVLLSPNPRLYAAFRRGFGGPDPVDTLGFLHGGLRIQALLWDSDLVS